MTSVVTSHAQSPDLIICIAGFPAFLQRDPFAGVLEGESPGVDGSDEGLYYLPAARSRNPLGRNEAV